MIKRPRLKIKTARCSCRRLPVGLEGARPRESQERPCKSHTTWHYHERPCTTAADKCFAFGRCGINSQCTPYDTYNEIFKYYYTENYYISMVLFVMRTFLLFYTPLSLLSLLLLVLLLLSMIYTCRSQFANQKCWSDFTQFIVSALKLNVSTFINPIFYLYRSRITNQLVWYDFTLFIVSITTLCYVYICLRVLYGDVFYSLT